jgi:PPP family 3-phenylpropionic acid transporter
MASASAWWGNAALRASLFHTTVFAPMAVSSVYLAIWLSEKGIQPEQIGIVGAAPVAGLLLLNLVVGRLADRAKDWRTVIVAMALLAGAFPVALFFVSDFWSIVLVWALCAMSSGLIPPVVDAATMRLVQRTGGDFGSIRAWGTVGYVISASSVGLAVMAFGTAAFVPLFFAISLLRALMSLQLPRFRAPDPLPTLAALNPAPAKLSAALKPWFVLPLLGFALINAGHGVLGSFAALLWHQHGVPDYFIGPLVATSALAEAVMMFLWQRFGKRVTARNMILAACIASLVRFSGMAMDPPVAVLFALQTLHAISYGVGYFGVVHFIANWTGEDIAAEAQGFATMLQQATLVVTLAGFGWLVAHIGVVSYLSISALSVLGIGCVLLSLRLRPPRDAT